MPRSPKDWHARFQQQAAWTESLRGYLFPRLGLGENGRLLEVGCGTGAITARLHAYTQSKVYGLDLNLPFLSLARQNDPRTPFTCGNAFSLPYPTAHFDAVVCHYFLLWVPQADAALAEMVRVTRPGGMLLALAEPDYGGRIDFPAPLAELGRLQSDALSAQGADPQMGRQLSGLFHSAGLREVETGLLGGQWQGTPGMQEIALEWATLTADLAGRIPTERLKVLEALNQSAWQSGQRVLFVPTFYALGKK